MINNKFRVFFLSYCLLSFENALLHAKAPSSADVLKSSAKFYPEILNALEGVTQAQYNIKAAEGAFDTRISSDISDRTIGYYSGSFVDTKLSKPLKSFNSEIYAGYRVADGTFPIYEDQDITTDGGEYYIGAKLSLLRNREIDQKRFKINTETFKARQASLKLKIKQLNIQQKALSHYWKWVAAGQRYYALSELLELAEKRQRQLKQKVLSGDLAAIYVQENKQYILKRKVLYNDAHMDFQKAAQDLSLFYRDLEGKPKIVTIDTIPSFDDKMISDIPYVAADLLDHPLFENIAFQRKILQQDVDLNTNNLLPKLDLDIKAANDIDNNNPTRDEEEVIVKLNFSIPLEQNIDKANLANSKSRLIQLSYSEVLLLEKSQAAFEKLLIELQNSRKNINFKKDEVTLAFRMLEAEKQRFNDGISDFFLVNMREEKITEAQLELIKEKEKFLLSLARIYAITGDVRALYLDQT